MVKNREEVVFEGGGGDTSMHTMTKFWYMLDFRIGLADVSALNFDHSFITFNAKTKVNAKKSSPFEFKC